MTADELRAWCLSLAGAVETFPFEPGLSVFKTEANNKIFAITDLASEPLDVSVKCDPDRAETLRATYEAIVAGYHLNKRHWITITFDADVPDDVIRDLIEDSYDLVRPRPRQARRQRATRARGD